MGSIADQSDLEFLFGMVADAIDLKADLVDGIVPVSQLPSYSAGGGVVDAATLAVLPSSGAANTIYQITSGVDANKQYRWTGTAYVQTNAGGGSSVDDAQAFIAAAGLTNTGQQNAIIALVSDLKSAGLWAKCKAIYPFIGGTALSHKWNLKNPIDSDGAFRLSFNGGWTHSPTGALPNGSTGYADSHFNPATNIGNNDGALGYYSRTSNSTLAAEIGVYDGSNLFQMHCNYSGNFYPNANTQSGYAESQSISGSSGFFQATRTSNLTTSGQRNGTLYNFASKPYGETNGTAFIGARRDTGGSAALFTDRECAFAYFGGGLTASDLDAFNTIVNTYQTSLGRNV